LAQELRTIINPYFLRREKTQILYHNVTTSHLASKENPVAVPIQVTLPKKQELVIWIPMTERQQLLYTEFLRSEDVKEVDRLLLKPQDGYDDRKSMMIRYYPQPNLLWLF
jgi:SNF2 family DNA or RNA helicase